MRRRLASGSDFDMKTSALAILTASDLGRTSAARRRFAVQAFPVLSPRDRLSAGALVSQLGAKLQYLQCKWTSGSGYFQLADSLVVNVAFLAALIAEPKLRHKHVACLCLGSRGKEL